MPMKKAYLGISVVLVLLLCAAQITGSTIVILACLAAFLALIGWSCSNNFTLPVLLFFLPWSPILRISPTSYSFFTFGLVLICAISIIKKRFHIKKYPLVTGIILLFLSLLSKLIDGNSLSFDYVAFMMLVILFPVVKGEWTVKKYDFYIVAAYFSIGIIIAALCALNLVVFPNIAKFITVDSYLTITRRCGFYGDPNFYTAQITAAMGGCLALMLKEEKRGRIVFLGINLVLLLYCGFLSASKSFAVVSLCIIGLWIVAVLRMKGKVGLKVTLLVGVVLLVVFVSTSAIFSELIEVMVTRFSYSKDFSSFTTGRTGLWKMYVEEIMGNAKIFFLGKGFTNVKVNDRASHNTLLQSYFQFGFLGVPFLVYWIVSFFRGAHYKGQRRKRQTLELLIIASGSFLPWLAIDALFFDEFFLLQWYMFSAIQQFQTIEVKGLTSTEDTYG